jgi:sigma-54 specific flagellar transcriptional regulator A
VSDLEKILGQYVIGVSEPATNLRARIAQVAPSDVPILIGGPTGAGKEYAARGIHSLSGRKGEPVAINCGAIPENLVEAELFGYERGAFSGAERRHVGYIERSHNGTLFLDEIGDLPLEVQVKLLRVIETQRFYRIGGKDEISADFRLVAASHKDLGNAVSIGKFREDLLYRINTIVLEVPPLRQRAEDVPEYFQLFLSNYNQRNSGAVDITFTSDFWDGLKAYSWPGNIRELRNVAERALIYFAGKTVTQSDLSETLLPKIELEGGKIGRDTDDTEPVSTFDDFLAATEFNGQNGVAETDPIEDFVRGLFLDVGEHAPLDFQALINKVEQEMVDQALQMSNGNVSKAAKLLNLRRSTLSSKVMKRKDENL